MVKKKREREPKPVVSQRIPHLGFVWWFLPLKFRWSVLWKVSHRLCCVCRGASLLKSVVCVSPSLGNTVMSSDLIIWVRWYLPDFFISCSSTSLIQIIFSNHWWFLPESVLTMRIVMCFFCFPHICVLFYPWSSLYLWHLLVYSHL